MVGWLGTRISGLRPKLERETSSEGDTICWSDMRIQGKEKDWCRCRDGTEFESYFSTLSFILMWL